MSFLNLTLNNPNHLPCYQQILADGACLEYLDTGVLRVRPAVAALQKVVISSGIHGNETAPMEIVDRLVNDIVSCKLSVRNEVLFIIGNPAAVNSESRFVEENLNRLFSGKHRQSKAKEASRAAQLEKIVSQFFDEGSGAQASRVHYDLHTAIRGSELEKFAVYPFLHSRDWSHSQLGFLEQCGIQAVLLSNQPSGTFSYFTSHEFGADAFTIELGKVRRFGENKRSNFIGIENGLRRVISGQEQFDQSPNSIKIFSVVEEVIKRTDAFKLHIADDAKNFTEYRAGALLASDEGYEYRTREDGERFVFPISNVPCGQRAMLIIAPVNLM